MPTFNVTWMAFYNKSINIEASTEEEAIEIAKYGSFPSEDVDTTFLENDHYEAQDITDQE